MRKKIISIVAITLIITACNDLDLELHDRIPIDDYTANPSLEMANIYGAMQNFASSRRWWYAQTTPGDYMVLPTRGEHWFNGGIHLAMHQHTWDNETPHIANMWSDFYEGVTAANEFIEIYELQAGDPIIDKALAKAKILRAYFYYLLIDNYGDVPYVTDFSDAPERPSLTAREEIFHAIVDEIETNVALLEPQSSTTAVTPAMAYSLLAKLYVNAGIYTGSADEAFWEKTIAYSDSVIAMGYSLEPDALGPFSATNQDSPENIWVIPYHEYDYPGFDFPRRSLPYMSDEIFDMKVGGYNGFCVMEDHFYNYEEEDRRRDGLLYGQQFSYSGDSLFHSSGEPVYLDPHVPGLQMSPGDADPVTIELAGARLIKYEIARGSGNDMNNHFPVFRYADILLMKAEALIRLNGPGAGDEYVNAIRNRAGLQNWENIDLDMLLDERSREMFAEGHRRQDLIRFGKFNDAWWEKPESSPERNTYPIPQWAIDANPNLEQ